MLKPSSHLGCAAPIAAESLSHGCLKGVFQLLKGISVQIRGSNCLGNLKLLCQTFSQSIFSEFMLLPLIRRRCNNKE